MCGIVGVISKAPVNQLIYDALLLLQHRGQDAAGIVTHAGHASSSCTRRAAWCATSSAPATCARCRATSASGQVRYPTAGNAYSEEEAQPFYVNAPFGIVLVHNGNLTNAHALQARAVRHRPPPHQHRERHRGADQRARARARARRARRQLTPDDGVRRGAQPCTGASRGSYAVVALIAGHGLLAFRDPYGIRPLCLRRRRRRRRHRGDGGERVGRARRHRPRVRRATSRRARRCSSTCEGSVHARAVRRAPDAQPVHVRVRLPGAARFGAWTASRSTRRA